MSGEDSYVRKFLADTDELEGNVTQCGGVTVRCAAFSPDGARIAVASEYVVSLGCRPVSNGFDRTVSS